MITMGKKQLGLLGRTREQLVGIILRKDAVEKELRSEIEYLKALCMAQDALELNIGEFGMTKTDIVAKNTDIEDGNE